MDEQKCTFKGCTAVGVPQKGFDFYVCPDCFVELERLLNEGYEKAHQRHFNN